MKKESMEKNRRARHKLGKGVAGFSSLRSD